MAANFATLPELPRSPYPECDSVTLHRGRLAAA